MPTWQPHLPALAASAVESFVCLGQSFVQLFDRAKSSPWLAQAVARCRIRICVQAANVFAAEFLDSSCSRQPMPLTSFPAWLGHSIVKLMQSALPIFLWRTYSRINLRCRFFPLLAWLPAPLGPVLDSLPKCASHAHLTLLHIASNIFLMSYGFSNGMNILSKRCHWVFIQRNLSILIWVIAKSNNYGRESRHDYHLRMFHLLNQKKGKSSWKLVFSVSFGFLTEF